MGRLQACDDGTVRRAFAQMWTASATVGAGQTQPAVRIAASCGVKTRSARPVEVMAKAGTRGPAQGAVRRTARSCTPARRQPSAERHEERPGDGGLRSGPGKTTAPSTTAAARPAATDPAMMRAIGPARRARRARSCPALVMAARLGLVLVPPLVGVGVGGPGVGVSWRMSPALGLPTDRSVGGCGGGLRRRRAGGRLGWSTNGAVTTVPSASRNWRPQPVGAGAVEPDVEVEVGAEAGAGQRQTAGPASSVVSACPWANRARRRA